MDILAKQYQSDPLNLLFCYARFLKDYGWAEEMRTREKRGAEGVRSVGRDSASVQKLQKLALLLMSTRLRQQHLRMRSF